EPTEQYHRSWECLRTRFLKSAARLRTLSRKSILEGPRLRPKHRRSEPNAPNSAWSSRIGTFATIFEYLDEQDRVYADQMAVTCQKTAKTALARWDSLTSGKS